MPVVNTPVGSSFQLRVQMGTDANGQLLYRTRAYSRVKPEAAYQNVYDVAQAIGGLQVHPVKAGINYGQTNPWL
ncbi:DUF1659 domain-containing protein [Moorella sp. Hama-1]|uniref:DUF1659 domain-containing protein n=1 Tax=Moorella sp. Hama-1 TaxID=2138101 RepID=UPI000D645AE3|nr:DUF1659 domain-containing protein [Moorella sp. Hama-1]BCV20221.1 hypothetical protein hamaS1_02900 [Moorella sp. Hama-1]